MGTVTVEMHDLILLSATWAVHDRLQVTMGGVPSPDDPAVLLVATAKLRLIDTGHFQGAVLGGGGAYGSFVNDLDNKRRLTLGAIGTFCASVSCRTTLSFYGLTNFVHEPGPSASEWNHSYREYLYGGSFIVKLGRPFKLVTEVNFGGETHKGVNAYRDGLFKGLVGVMGFRIHGQRAAGLIGFMVLFARADAFESESQNVLTVLPAVSFGWRFGP